MKQSNMRQGTPISPAHPNDVIQTHRHTGGKAAQCRQKVCSSKRPQKLEQKFLPFAFLPSGSFPSVLHAVLASTSMMMRRSFLCRRASHATRLGANCYRCILNYYLFRFSSYLTQRAQRSKKFDLDRNFQSRSKFLIPPKSVRPNKVFENLACRISPE